MVRTTGNKKKSSYIYNSNFRRNNIPLTAHKSKNLLPSKNSDKSRCVQT